MSITMEQQTTETNPQDALLQVAEAHGIELDAERSRQLAGVAKYTENYGHGGAYHSFIDGTNWLTVGRVKQSDEFGATAAKVDFTPTFEEDGDLVSGSVSARPDRAAAYGLMGLHGLQNYVLCVEAGLVEKPAVLFGRTNAEMAIVAERVGMHTEIAKQHDDNPAEGHKAMRESEFALTVYGEYEEVAERVFSEDNRKLEKVLERRVAAQQVAELAIAAS